MKWTSRENKLFFLLSKFNCVSLDNIRNYCVAANKSIGFKRLTALEKAGYIEKITVIEKDLKETESYVLGKRGIKEVKDRYSNYYKSNSTVHDLKHSNFVFNKFKKEDIQYYRHEKELPTPARGGGASRADGAFVYPSGDMILVETYTRNYTEERKDAKKAYADELGCDMYINYA